MNQILFIVPIIGLLGLLLAIMLGLHVIGQDPGNQKMREIADAIAGGVRAFLTSEYRVLIVFVALSSIIVSFEAGSWVTTGCFLVGGFFSTATGYLGMSTAIRVSCHTANTAHTSGMRSTLALAFSNGSVMGMAVVGLRLMRVGALYVITRDVSILSDFSLGASSITLFAHVEGGVYTRAADVGTDLMGRVETGIPEDDPRNPVVIVGNAGDNVGDVVGMGADLFESYVGSPISTLTLGLVFYQESGVILPLLFSVCSIAASIVGALLVKAIEGTDPYRALKAGEYGATALVVIAALALSRAFFGNYLTALTVITGLFMGVLIGSVTEIYTSRDYRFVKKVAGQSETSSATTIISGLAVGMQSTAVPILLVCIDILIFSRLMGLYGITLATVGMLSITGIIVAIDVYGPITDSAGDITEIAGLDKSVREITDKLDSMGNAAITIGKGFAIGSAALTVLALFISYAKAAKLTTIDILNAHVIVGLFIDGMLTFLFFAMAVESVSGATHQMIKEVRRQFRENPQILQGNARPDYTSCVSTSTTAALREMLLPGPIAVLAPLATGITLGSDTLGGLLIDSLVTSVLMTIFMSNSGGARDNAKRYIKEGNYGGKGSTTHRAAVIDDTVGDPFKGTSGPSINILVKLMTIVSLIFVPLFLQYGGLI